MCWPSCQAMWSTILLHHARSAGSTGLALFQRGRFTVDVTLTWGATIVHAPVANRVLSVHRMFGRMRTHASVSSDLHFASDRSTVLSRRAAGESPLTGKYLTLLAPFTFSESFG